MNNNERILILGVTGMLGYNLYTIFKQKGYDIYGTCRNKYDLKDYDIYRFDHTIEKVKEYIDHLKPKIILNCLAILQENGYQDKLDMLNTNTMLPIALAEYCKEKNIYFIHFSTDCVFKSKYEYHPINDTYSPENYYGLTKALSESISKDALVLRICPIGYDKFKKKSLFNFIYSNANETINGYTNCFFNGTTVNVIADKIDEIIKGRRILGIHHITGPIISKFKLLEIINKTFNLNKKIIDVDLPHVCRLLEDDLTNSGELNWKEMIKGIQIL